MKCVRHALNVERARLLRERSIPMMAYSPIEQGRLLRNAKLVEFSRKQGMTPAQAALAWLLAPDDVIVIPKCAHRERLRENLAVLEFRLAGAQLEELDRLFPPPARKRSKWASNFCEN